jgi:hypothetical protein
MLKLYRKSQEVQLNWIRNHPFQYIALNAILLGAWIGYVEYKDRKELRQLENEVASKN